MKGANFKFHFETPTLFSVVNGSETEVIFMGSDGFYAGAGKYNNSKMVIWPRSKLAYNYKPKKANDTFLLNSMMAYLTDGNCTNYESCYFEIPFYKEKIGKRNVVFGVRFLSYFDFHDFTTNAVLYQWHVLFTGRFPKTENNKEVNNLLRLYGYCAESNTTDKFFSLEINICKRHSGSKMQCP